MRMEQEQMLVIPDVTLVALAKVLCVSKFLGSLEPEVTLDGDQVVVKYLWVFFGFYSRAG